jgi:Leucine-rich repeat (LRR) protein
LNCAQTRVQDFAPVRQLLQLQELRLDFVPWRDSAVLRSLPAEVRLFNGGFRAKEPLPRAEYCAWADWEDSVRKLEPEKQLEAVRAKLKELNPQFDGALEKLVGKEGVYQLGLTTTHVKDISPVRALSHLKRLICDGKTGGALTDLAPLRGMSLESLAIGGNPVQDLSALQGMPLQDLRIASTRVQDLESVRDLPLRNLYCPYTRIANLSPLAGMKTLQNLSISHTAVNDLSPLKACPLQNLECDFVPERDAAILRQIPTLRTINGQKKEELLK